MEYKKIANLIDRDASSEPSKFRIKNWVQINDESRRTYNANGQVKFKTTILKSSLRDYVMHIFLLKELLLLTTLLLQMLMQIILIKKIIFKNSASFTNCISEINNTQVDKSKDIDIVIPMYNLIEYSDNYSITSGSL